MLLVLSVGGLVGSKLLVAGPMMASTVGGLVGAANTLSARARRLQGRPVVAASGLKR